MTRRTRTPEERNAVLAHLRYELGMLSMAANALHCGALHGSAVENALIESFALHARNLIDFFWPDGAKTDHVLATDFFDDKSVWEDRRSPLPPILCDARRRAHKEIAHLSYDRLRVAPESRGWNFKDIASELHRCNFAFYELLPVSYREAFEGGNEHAAG